MHCCICSRTCHGEPRTGIEVCGQQHQAVYSSRIQTHTHKPTRRSTVCGCRNGKSLKRGYCTVAGGRDEKRENNVWWRWRKREIACGGSRALFFGFAWAWLALTCRKAIPWLMTSFRDFEPPEYVSRTSSRAHACAQCSRGPPACSKRKDPRALEQKMPMP